MASNGVRFIRVNGRIVPIKEKDPTKKQLAKNYNKYGDGANQASRIDDKYNKKATKAGTAGGVVGAAGLIGAALGKNKKFKIAAAAIGVGGILYGNFKASRVKEKTAVSREKEYIKAFGMTSAGVRPSATKKGAKLRK